MENPTTYPPITLKKDGWNHYIQVWHPASPGIRVIVKRGLLKRALYPKQFATLGEKQYNRNEI